MTRRLINLSLRFDHTQRLPQGTVSSLRRLPAQPPSICLNLRVPKPILRTGKLHLQSPSRESIFG